MSRFRLARAAGDELHQAVAGGDRDAVGEIAPGPVEEPARYVVFLTDRADLGATRAADAPEDPDVLLVRLDRRYADLALDIKVRRLAIVDDRQIMPAQHRGHRRRQRFRAVSGGAADLA